MSTAAVMSVGWCRSRPDFEPIHAAARGTALARSPSGSGSNQCKRNGSSDTSRRQEQEGRTMTDQQRQQPLPVSPEKARAESRRRREERKKAQQAAVNNGGWERCLYRVPGKKRYCAQYRSKHSTQYCGTHMGATQEKGRRIPCPVDPNHTVFEQQLASHVKICNLTLQQAQMETQPYYVKGINSGPALPREEGVHEARSGDVAAAAALDEAFVLDLISRVGVAHQELVGSIPTEVLDPPEVQALHRARTEDGTGFRKGRHVLQHASLVGHLLKRGLVGSCSDGSRGDGSTRSSVLHVEMGAGKGALGLSIATAFPGADVTMVERSSVRRKAENRLDGVSARARIDIRDLDMAGLPSIVGEGDDRPVVAVAKHLCGVATDLALRAMLTLPQQKETDSYIGSVASGSCGGDSGGRPASSRRVGGVAIATCCHHACNWRDYAGREFLVQQGFSARDFEAMRRISAWISLEPDAGARKNNKYPEERHPRPPSPAARPGQFSAAPVASGGQQQTAAAEAAVAAASVLARKRDEGDDSRPEEGRVDGGANVNSQTDHCTDETGRETARRFAERAGVGEAATEGAGGDEHKEASIEKTPPSSVLNRGSASSSTPRVDAKASLSSPQPLRPRGAPSHAAVPGAAPADEAEAPRETIGDDSAGDLPDQPPLPPASDDHPAAAMEGRTKGQPSSIHAPSLTPAEKAKAARECKRLLDRGRMAFIQARLGLRSEIVHFVGRDITPENALLLGFREDQ